MRYYLDTEFNSFGGELISLGLVREDGAQLYIVYELPEKIDLWVATNVIPFLYKVPDTKTKDDIMVGPVDPQTGANFLAQFLKGDETPVIITDWPDDIRYFCTAIITGPGTMVNIPYLIFNMMRVDAYPTTLEDAIQHNALWDALALKEKLTPCK